MAKLSDTQAIILSAAAQREGHIALPLPGTLRGGAATKVVSAMLRKGLIDEVEANPRKGEAHWRETGDGHGTTLVATDAGLTAIGIEPTADGEDSSAEAVDVPAETDPEPKARTPRAGTKQALLIEMLRAEGGATIDEIAAALNWRAHTIRGAMSGALKKRLGLDVTSEKDDKRGRIYKLPPA